MTATKVKWRPPVGKGWFTSLWDLEIELAKRASVPARPVGNQDVVVSGHTEKPPQVL
jgi:hypothetical protein